MEENIYQNIDLTNNNPLKPEAKPEESFSSKLKTDRKIQILVGLSGLTVILLILALIVSFFKNIPKKIDLGDNLPTPVAIPTVINEVNVLPSQYQSQFDTIENKLKYNPEILPPEIDLNLGN